MGMGIRLRGVLVIALGLGSDALGLSWAQDNGVVRSATVLPAIAASVDKSRPNESFKEELSIAARVEKTEKVPTKQVYLNFDLTTVPEGACVSNWALRLFVNTKDKDSRPQTVRVLPVEFKDNPSVTWNSRPSVPERAQSVSDASIYSTSQKVDFNYPVKLEEQCPWLTTTKHHLSVVLESTTSGVEYTYHGLASTCEADANRGSRCNTQPRLIVEYYMPPLAADANWPQEHYDPQHSGRTAWKTSADKTGFIKPRIVYSPDGYTVGAPIMYKGRLIFHSQLDNQGSKKFFISALDGRGRQVWKNADIQAVVKYPPAVDTQGRLYLVTENCLLVLNADDGGRLKSACLSESCPNEPCKGTGLLNIKGETSIRATPTLGVNGAVYLSTNTGVFALTPYPELKVGWRFGGKDSHFGPVALSTDEATAYVVGGTGTAGKVFAIDNTDGNERWHGGSLTLKQESLPVPVIGAYEVDAAGKKQRHELIYVVNGYDQGNLIQVFVQKEECPEKECEPAKIEGMVSRPVVGADGHAYFVKRDQNNSSGGRLCRDRWASVEASQVPPIVADCPQKNGAGSASDNDLSPSSLLAADGKGNVYVIDYKSDPQKVRGYKPDFSKFSALEVPRTTSGSQTKSTNFGPNLLIGDDGTLYNANANVLVAIEPKVTVDTLPLLPSAVQPANQMTFLAAHKIIVLGSVRVNAGQSFVLKSGGSIRFLPGVRVAKGARLRCETGAPQ
jgi:hypothetical protein